MTTKLGTRTAAKMTVADYMTPGPHTVGREQPLATARQVMREHHIRHLPVLQGGQLVGVLSERELALFESLPAADAAALTVEEVMTPGSYTVSETAPLGAVAADMAELKLGSAVVQRGERVVGVLSAVDLLRALADCLRPAG